MCLNVLVLGMMRLDGVISTIVLGLACVRHSVVVSMVGVAPWFVGLTRTVVGPSLTRLSRLAMTKWKLVPATIIGVLQCGFDSCRVDVRNSAWLLTSGVNRPGKDPWDMGYRWALSLFDNRIGATRPT